MPNKNEIVVCNLKNDLKADLKNHGVQLLNECMLNLKDHALIYLHHAAENCFDSLINYLNNKLTTTTGER